MAGAHLDYATRGTQDLTWEVPILGNTLPRVYTPGCLLPHRVRGSTPIFVIFLNVPHTQSDVA